ncbi:hypothetical protein BG004_007697 [Podila humilis]|nr:hypothetical protein BG004_007697 [Podila humilis]
MKKQDYDWVYDKWGYNFHLRGELKHAKLIVKTWTKRMPIFRYLIFPFPSLDVVADAIVQSAHSPHSCPRAAVIGGADVRN